MISFRIFAGFMIFFYYSVRFRLLLLQIRFIYTFWFVFRFLFLFGEWKKKHLFLRVYLKNANKQYAIAYADAASVVCALFNTEWHRHTYFSLWQTQFLGIAFEEWENLKIVICEWVSEGAWRGEGNFTVWIVWSDAGAAALQILNALYMLCIRYGMQTNQSTHCVRKCNLTL